ncbi:MAG: SIS domain-containing protein [Chloroflexota bacterium]|nr:SIS domain-containing protein [Chloroflexota bacterium]
MSERLQRDLDAHLAVAREMHALLPAVAEVGRALCGSLAADGKLIAFGNGGSAADAQHFAAELLGRFRRERRAIPAIALTTDTSVLTAIANDYDYPDVYARQLTAIARPGDMVVGITTSGRSENVVRGLAAARERSAVTVALTGRAGVRGDGVDHVLAVPSDETARVQEMHILLIHLLSEMVDEWSGGQSGT